MMNYYNYDINILPLKDFYSLKNIWLTLEKNRSIFSSFMWKKAFIESFYNKEYYFALLFEKNIIKIILPFQINNNIIQIIGTPRSDYNELLGNYNFEQVNFLLCYLKNKYKKYNFVLSDILLNDSFKFLLKSQDYMVSKASLVHKINLDQIDSIFKKEAILRKTKKIYRENLKIEYKIIRNKNEIFFYLEKLFFLHKKKWNKTSTPSQFEDKKNILLYYNLTKNLNIENIQMNILFIENNVSAIHFGFIFNNNFYYYKPIYDEEYFEYSPGILLIAYIISNLKIDNIKIFDFLRGNEDYKKRYSNIIDYTYKVIF